MGARIDHSFLSGSYARDTAIRPLDDVDIIFVIDAGAWKRTTWQRFIDAPPAPSVVLGSMARAIRYRYRQHGMSSRVQVQRRSVGLVMNHLTIDVVPAVVHDSREHWLYVPDTRTGTWIDTAPQVHATVASTVNARCSNTLKPLVRLLKGWNGSLASTVRLKSFAIETIVTRLLDAHPQHTHLDGAFAFFDYLAGEAGSARNSWSTCGMNFGSWRPCVPDVGGTGSDLLAGVDSARRIGFLNAARVTRDAFENAFRARTEDFGWSNYLERRFRAGMTRI